VRWTQGMSWFCLLSGSKRVKHIFLIFFCGTCQREMRKFDVFAVFMYRYAAAFLMISQPILCIWFITRIFTQPFTTRSHSLQRTETPEIRQDGVASKNSITFTRRSFSACQSKTLRLIVNIWNVWKFSIKYNLCINSSQLFSIEELDQN